MTELYDIPQNTRIKAIVSVNTAFFGWFLGGLPSCLMLLFPPGLLCTLPLFIVLSAIGGFTGYQARKEMAEGVSDPRMNWISTMGLFMGGAGVVVGILASLAIVVMLVLGIGLTALSTN